MNMKRLQRIFLTILISAAAGTVDAQESPEVRKIVLPSLDSQVRARLIALDRRLVLVNSPALAASLVGHALAPVPPLPAFTPILADARNLEAWEQLPEEYYRLMQEAGEALVGQPGVDPAGAVSSTQARRFCHQRLAALPRASLALYRQRVDAEAAALLAQATRTRSPLPLRRIADELFCSSVGDQALDLLGDLAFERGQFGEAQHWWSLLVPLSSEPTAPQASRLRFPDPRIDLVRTQSKRTLALIFQGRLDEARTAIACLQEDHPHARGILAGQEDIYGNILQKTLNSFAENHLVNNDGPWTTFGGSATRNRVLTQGIPLHLFDDGPTWRVKLPGPGGAGKAADAERSYPARRAAFHCVIVGQQVLIADCRTLVSYQLTTGKEHFRFEVKDVGLAGWRDIADTSDARNARFTLTVDRERAYARFGRPGYGPPPDKEKPRKDADKEGPSCLVCLDLTEPDKKKPRLLWHVENGPDGKSSFEGAPLVQEGLVYMAASKLVGRRTTTSIVCYDAGGKQRWTREVCDGPEFEENANGLRYRQHLLTWGEGQIVYCTHAGAIVAVDAWTGQPTWGVRYASRGPLTADGEPSPRELAPCVYADGRVFAAPADTDRLFCIDALTGEMQWELDGIEVVHLLGVAQGRVHVATRTGVQAVSVANGQADWIQPIEGRLPSLGRGVLAGSWLFWPTTDATLPYRAVSLQSGEQLLRIQGVMPEPEEYDPARLWRVPTGNLAFGEGCLAVAGPDELAVFVPPAQQPKSPLLDHLPQTRIQMLYHQARREVDTGKPKKAAQSYRQLLELTRAQPHAADWQTLIEVRLQELGPAAELRSSGTVSSRERGKSLPAQVVTDFSKVPPLPLARAWVQSGGRAWAPSSASPPAGEGVFFSTEPGVVTCRRSADGEPRWQRKLDFVPSWFGCWRDLVIIAGPDGVQALNMDDGGHAWAFRAPSRRSRFGSVIDGIPHMANVTAGLVHIEIWNDTLLLLDDHRWFYRLRLDTGAIDWQYASAGAALRPLDAGSFVPHLLRVGNDLLVQAGNGKPLWLMAHNQGAEFVPAAETARHWQQAPRRAGEHIAFASEGGRIHFCEQAPPHRLSWTYQAPWATSLTGAPCRLISKDEVLLALVPRNDGSEWVRLDASRSRVLWGTRAHQMRGGLDIDSICVGDLAYYYVCEGRLYARSLNDGSVQWQQPLPAHSHWQIRYTKSYLAVYSAGEVRENEFWVGFVDPADGQWLQRLTFANARGTGAVILTPRQVLVSCADKIYGFRALERE
jgi:outer membrane protein assembly factor BamB